MEKIKIEDFIVHKINEYNFFKKTSTFEKIEKLMNNIDLKYNELLKHVEEYNNFEWTIYSDFRLIYNNIINIINYEKESDNINIVKLKLDDMNNEINNIKKKFINLKKK